MPERIKSLAEYEADIRAANDNHLIESGAIGRMRAARLVSLRSEEAAVQDRRETYRQGDDEEVAITTGVYDE